jgi:hypothetical protein
MGRLEMQRLCISVIAAFCCGVVAAQEAGAPSTPNPPATVGYSYTLPADWEIMRAKPLPPAPNPSTILPRKGTACTEVAETAKHGDPASIIVIVDLPFNCFGQTMTPDDLAGFGSGASDGLKQDFDLIDVLPATYTLGSHAFWMERARGNPKGRPQPQYTIEIACTLLKKGAVCWMAMATDEASLHVFEQTPVTLDGDTATPLVPASALIKPPAGN